MAVTAVLKRVHVFKFAGDGSQEAGNATLTGTYATGGFTYSLTSLTGTPGTSPYYGTPVVMDWYSPTGFIYVSTFVGNVMTTKIFSAPGTELANGTTPEGTVPFVLTRRRVTT